MAVGPVGLGLVDCHCHLSAPDFNSDLDAVLEKAKKANVMALVAVAEHAGEFERIMQLSERYTGFILPCLGVHPVQELSPEKPRSVTLKDLDVALPIIEKYKDRLLAIGEVGLDFSPRFAGTDEEKEEQRQVLIRQVQLAKRLNVPLNVHSRSAGRPTINLLREQGPAACIRWSAVGGHGRSKGGLLLLNSTVHREKWTEAEACETAASKLSLLRNRFTCTGTGKTDTE
ncbi:deoxyribonuclease TATDN3 isoform X5 [Peromyscus maniculatus bairdii]|uniref:deoxyribonuclease TATDN3 isoform X5 n=1 Tax=Peromyscus maniculatus bairdii TaxID=230844 RepID=UPI001C2ED911|nr:putative deoxyribonuclease TATDN3 isoform X5 [Peromyscus maniculatus bairdii]